MILLICICRQDRTHFILKPKYKLKNFTFAIFETVLSFFSLYAFVVFRMKNVSFEPNEVFSGSSKNLYS